MLEKGDKIGDYTVARFLGKGQFGEVWLAEKHLQFSSRKFQHALKFLSNLGNEIDLKSAEAEIDTWIEASGHPNVMSVLDMFAHNEHIIIVSEYAEGGSLKGRNTARDPRVSISIVDFGDPYSEAQIQGRVVERRPDPQLKEYDAMSRKYVGRDWPYRDAKEPLVLVIEVMKEHFAKQPFEHAPTAK